MECLPNQTHLWKEVDILLIPTYRRLDNPAIRPHEVCIKCWKRQLVDKPSGNTQLTYN